MIHTGAFVISFLLCSISRSEGLHDPSTSNNQIQAPILLMKKDSGLWRDLFIGAVSGAAAGLVTDVSCYPIETIKTRLQSGASAKVNSQNVGTLSNNMNGLLAGVEVNLVASPLNWGLYFAAYEPCRVALSKALNASERHLEWLVSIISSTLATFACFITRVPSEVIKTRRMTGSDSNTLICIRRILEKEGIAGFYTGFWSLMLRELPFNVFEMVIYEHVRGEWSRKLKAGQELVGWETSVVAVVCDGLVGLLTNPFDVVKTQLMDQAGNGKDRSGLMGTAALVLQRDGIGGFFQGSLTRAFYLGIGGVIFWVVLEEVQASLRRLE